MRGDRADPRRPAARARHRAGPARGLRGRLARRRLRQGDGVVIAALAARHRGLLSLGSRETHRVLKLWTQTVVAPILSSLLFILVFGLSLGGRIHHVDGVPYDDVHRPRAHHDGDDPGDLRQQLGVGLPGALRPLPQRRARRADAQLGGQPRAVARRRRARARSSAAGCCSACCRSSTCPIREPLVLVARARARRSCCSRRFGVIVGIYANAWDHTAFVTNIVILPLTFLGGVFYSVDVLPSPWHELSHLNPIFYLLNAVRYGFLGTSDVSVAAVARGHRRRWRRGRRSLELVAVSDRAPAEAVDGPRPAAGGSRGSTRSRRSRSSSRPRVGPVRRGVRRDAVRHARPGRRVAAAPGLRRGHPARDLAPAAAARTRPPTCAWPGRSASRSG